MGGPSMLAFGPVGSQRMMQHLEANKMKIVGKCLSDRSMYKIYFCFTSLVFLIRTQAVGVFSEVSSQWDRPTHRVWNSNCMNKKCGWPPIYSLFNFFIISSPSPQTQLSSPSLSQLLFFSSFSAGHWLSPSGRGRISSFKQWVGVSMNNFQCSHFLCCSSLRHKRHPGTAAAALCLHFWHQPHLCVLLLQLQNEDKEVDFLSWLLR